MNNAPLDYHEWFDKNEDELDIEIMETGACDEMDFDADRFYERKYEEYLKRHEEIGMAFITGSHAYGTPHRNSDVDLVVRMPAMAAWQLASLSDKWDENAAPPYPDDSIQMRFGNINVIACCKDEVYQLWLEGTSELELKKPGTRDEAVATFKRLREEA